MAALAPAASARTVVLDPVPPQASIELTGSHGYAIDVSLSAGREAHGGASYLRFEGNKVSRDRVYANLGHIARVDARFVPSGKVHRQRGQHCDGATVERFGVFVGRIRFSGERGYTEVKTRRAPGSITAAPRRVCHFPKRRRSHRHHKSKKARKGPLVTTFNASSGETQLQVSETPLGRDARFFAVRSERREGVLIWRHVFLDARAADFSFDPQLESATVSPPAPFAGSARFERIDDHASRWEGPLTVSLPGAPDVPLTGRDFAWRLTAEHEHSSSGVSLYVSGDGRRR